MEQNNRTPFRQALLDAALESYADLPAEDQINVEFSDTFMKKSKQLLGRSHKSRKSLRRVLLAAAMISLLVVIAVAGAAQRTYLFQYTITEFGNYYELRYTDTVPADAPDHLQIVYCPTYIPEGYELEKASDNRPTGVQYTWRNGEGMNIVYAQSIIEEDQVFRRISKNTENPVVFEGVLIDGYDVLRIVSDFGTAYYWIDGEYFHYLAIGPGISQDEQMEIFYSITVDESLLLNQP